ncbi:hypothetical protein H9P43_009165 [Blastocladiella emersonii ATCC 22665]|nr:hypothetical protein H9P43_009165 [Blastocladiella emersonii ATCC 22665]
MLATTHQVKLDIFDIVDAILYRATVVHAYLHPRDVVGLAQYSRVAQRDLIPTVAHMILLNCPALSIDTGSRTGNVAALDLWMWSRLSKSKRYSVEALNCAIMYNLWPVLAWWRDSGLELRYTTLNDKARTALDLPKGAIDAPNGGLSFPHRGAPYPTGDALIHRIADDVARVRYTEVILEGERITVAGMAELARALKAAAALMESPAHPAAEKMCTLEFNYCDIDAASARVLGAAIPPSVTRFNIFGNHLCRDDPDGFAVLRLPPGLRELDISENGDVKHAAGMARFAAQLPRSLESFTLNKTALDAPGVMAALAPGLALPNLRRLILARSRIGSGGARALAAHLPPNLVELNLTGGSIDDAAFCVLAPRLPRSLRMLLLGPGNAIESAGAVLLAKHMPPALLHLNLGYSKIGEAGATALAAALPATLTELVLSHNEITAPGIRALAAALASRVRSLQVLDLAWNAMGTAAGLDLSRALPPSLVSLDLRHVALGTRRSRSLIAALPRSLSTLVVGENGVDAAAVRGIPPALACLDLTGNHEFGDAGALALADVMPRELQKLVLFDCQIEPAGFQALARRVPRSLMALDVAGNAIDQATLNLLAAACPEGCQLQF